MTKIKVAVLGYGHLGKWHSQKAEQFPDLAEMTYIVEQKEENKNAAKAAHPKVQIVDDYKKILNSADAFFVITPTSTHFSIVKDLLQAGKHVFCEKPLTTSYEECLELNKYLKPNQVLQIGHSERCHQAWDKLKDTFNNIPDGSLIKLIRKAPFKGRAVDVDVVQDLAIHDLDLILYLFNKKVKSVYAHGLKIRTKNDDHVWIDLELENNIRAVVEVGRNATTEVREMEVISRDGTILVDLFRNKILKAPKGEISPEVYVSEETYDKRDHLLVEHKAFYLSIAEKKDIMVNYQDALNVIKLMSQISESLKQGRRVLCD